MAKQRKKATRGLYQRENGMWYCRIAGQDGKMIRKALSMDYATAKVMLHEMRKRADLERIGLVAPDSAEEIKTFPELFDLYMAHLKARAMSEHTLINYKLCYKRLILGNNLVYLRDLSVKVVEDWAKREMEGGTTGQTVNLYVTRMRCMLAWALNNGYIRKNVLVNWMPVRINEGRLRRDFQPEEIQKLFASEDNPEWRLRWLVYFNTGLRLTAGRNLRWEWIDWIDKLIRLPLEENKSRRKHEIPMTNVLYTALAEYREKLGNPQSGAIFKPVSGNRTRDRLQKACIKAGIDPRGLCVHSIRHTVATIIYKNTEGNLKAVQEILGHAGPATTMRYLHVTREEKRAALDTMDLEIFQSGTAGQDRSVS